MSGRATGASAQVTFSEEASWGQHPAAPTSGLIYGLSLKNESMGIKKNTFKSEMINSKRAVVGITDGNKAVDGSIATDLLPEGLEILFAHLLGEYGSYTAGSGYNTRVIKGVAATLPGLLIEKGYVDIGQYVQHTGCRINSMAIRLVQEGIHEVSFDIIGKDQWRSSATAYGTSAVTLNRYDIANTPEVLPSGLGAVNVTPTKDGYNGYEIEVWTTIDSGGTNVPGVYTQLSNVVSGAINITNNVETDGYVFGDSFRASAQYLRRECSGEFACFFENLNIYTHFITGTEVGVMFKFIRGNYLMQFKFPRCKLGGETPAIAGIGGMNLPLRFEAAYDTGTGTDVELTMTNTTANI